MKKTSELSLGLRKEEGKQPAKGFFVVLSSNSTTTPAAGAVCTLISIYCATLLSLDLALARGFQGEISQEQHRTTLVCCPKTWPEAV